MRGVCGGCGHERLSMRFIDRTTPTEPTMIETLGGERVTLDDEAVARYRAAEAECAKAFRMGREVPPPDTVASALLGARYLPPELQPMVENQRRFEATLKRDRGVEHVLPGVEACHSPGPLPRLAA